MNQRFLSTLLSTFFLSSSLLALDDPIEGYRSKVDGLADRSISEMDIRSDGRYLFYSQGSASFGVIDLQDFVTGRDFSIATESSVQGVFLLGDARLAVVGTQSIQYFDVGEVFEPEEESDSFEFPSSADTTPTDACLSESGRIFVLEEHPSDDDGHLIRLIDNKDESDQILWTELIDSQASRYIPLGLRCAGSFVYVLSVRFDENEDGNYYIHRFSAATGAGFLEPFDIHEEYEDYELVDLAVEPGTENVLLLLNRLVNENNEDDALAVRINNGNFASRTEQGVGQGGQGISFYRSSGQVHYGFFVQTDLLEDVASQRSENFMLRIASGSFSSGNFLEDRGTGLTTVSEARFSEWILPESDHYAFGLIESSGVSLVSSSLDLRLSNVSTSSNASLSSDTDLTFSMTAPFDGEYEIRFSESLPEEGNSSAIDTNFGKEIASGDLEAGEPLQIVLSVDDIGVTKNRNHSIAIYATQKRSSSTPEIARRGVFFRFDPPPQAVTDFRLAYGDQGVFVFFRSNENSSEDLDRFLIYFSYDQTALEALPTSETSLAEWRASNPAIQLVDGSFLGRPIELNASRERSIRYAIGPVENNLMLFVRVQVVDNQGQFSSENPAALGISPLQTRTLPGALGSPESCQLRASRPGLSLYLCLFLFLVGLVLEKKWAQRLRNRRGGD